MEVFYITLMGIFLCTSIIFSVFLFRFSKKIKILNEENQDKDNLLSEKTQIIKNRDKTIYECKKLLLTNRIGYYDFTISLIESKDNSTKSYIVRHYIKEIEKYKNGESKIELTELEVISGFDPNQYTWVKTSVKARFCSVKKTDEIEWLEVEEDLKELRKEKLKKLF